MLYSALLGNPVDHSVSPELFKFFTERTKIEYAHIKIRVPSNKDLKMFLTDLQRLNFCGANITLPYKLSVIKELDDISKEAKKIGAVNTVVFKNAKMIGHNTDARGAFLAIEKKLKKISKGDQILILGAGGAARAIIFEIYKKCKNINILNIDINQAKKVSDDLSSKGYKIKFNSLNDNSILQHLKECNLIINATSVGMYPERGEIISQKIFNHFKTLKNKYFFDAIFNPYKTKFLFNAEKRGARVCSGTYMMIYQAIYAFKLWTGIELKIDIEKVNKHLMKFL